MVVGAAVSLVNASSVAGTIYAFFAADIFAGAKCESF